MAFVFTLESVLRLRMSQERQEQSRLEIVAQQVHAAQERCESLKRERLELEENTRNQMQTGITSDDLHMYRASLAGIEVAETAAVQVLDKVREQWHEQRGRFLAARRNRELLSSLRQRQHDAYILEQSRREQQQIDDLFAMRRLRYSND